MATLPRSHNHITRTNKESGLRASGPPGAVAAMQKETAVAAMRKETAVAAMRKETAVAAMQKETAVATKLTNKARSLLRVKNKRSRARPLAGWSTLVHEGVRCSACQSNLMQDVTQARQPERVCCEAPPETLHESQKKLLRRRGCVPQA